jgi:4-oxalocrotonate tautomerase
MPIIKVEMLEGRTVEQKRKITEGIVKVMVEEAKVKPEAIRIIFSDMKKEDLAIGDKLALDL